MLSPPLPSVSDGLVEDVDDEGGEVLDVLLGEDVGDDVLDGDVVTTASSEVPAPQLARPVVAMMPTTPTVTRERSGVVLVAMRVTVGNSACEGKWRSCPGL